jgi:branched-chain amino acid transport system ATP-binding protein
MTAIGRALMSNPRLLLCDELSLGLAPAVIREIYACLGAITAEGTALLIVEQDINRALDAAARFYCLLAGRVALTAPCRGFDRQAITSAYFGL